MASLNTLRTRGGWIISIVIGVALIAFLLGDFVPKGCSDHYVGEINGTKIDYMDYSKEVERYTFIYQSMTGKESLTTEEHDQVRDMAWTAMVNQHAYSQGFEKLGMIASETEQIDMVSGAYLSPVITGMFANQQTGQFDPARLREFTKTAEVDEGTNLLWDYVKQQMNEHRVMSKFLKLVSAGMFVNNLEAEAGVEAENNSYNTRFLTYEYSSMPDSTVNVTKQDIKAYYDLHKKKYKQEASREVEYVTFDMLPSQMDYNESEKFMNELAEDFTESNDPMQFAVQNSQVRPDRRFLSESQVTDPAIAAAVYGKPDGVYGPVLQRDVYTMARQGEVKMLPDTLGARHILLPISDKKTADSLIIAIKGKADFASLASQYSQDQSAAVNGGNLGRFAPEQMVEEFSNACIAANPGEVFTATSQFGLHVIELTYKSTLVKKAQIAIIKYNVEPSEATRQAIYAEASTFLTKASGSYDNFRKAASEASLVKRVARISNTDRSVSNLNDSREMVRWAFNSKRGTVSGIMELGGDYVISALTGVRETGISSMEEVADLIRPTVIREKKAEKIIENIKGSSLDEVSANTGAEVNESNDVKFGLFSMDNVMGSEQRLIGAVCAGLETGKLSKPVKGNNGVYMFELSAMNTEENATTDSERVKRESMFNEYFIGQRITQAMQDAGNITDNRVKYF